MRRLSLLSMLLISLTGFSQSVYDFISNSPNHTTLTAAIDAAGLDATLSGAGTFTVFAPDDNAFAALPPGTVEALLLDPSGDLTTILTYHVLGAVALAENLTDGQMEETLQGESITITLDMGNVFVNDAQVTDPNFTEPNGVVHVIDAVLLPPSFLLPETVVDIIVDSPDHETLEAAVIAAELADDLSGEGPFTVFAPTDEAFAALGTLVDELLLDPTGDLAEALLYHVLGAQVLAEDITDGQIETTLQGEDISFTIVDGDVFINETTQVVITNIQAQNGVVHVIDAVLLPPSFSLPETVVDIIVESAVHTILEVAVTQAELIDDLSGDGPFTVFAPTNEAFTALPFGTLEALLLDPTGDLAQILLYHVLGGEAFAEDLSDGQMEMTLQGEEIEISIVDGDVFINGSAQVTVTNIQARNGVVHVIDAVLIPPTLVSVYEFDNAASAGLKVGPNPASDFFNIQFPASLNTNAQVMIYDLNGRLVKTEVVRDIFSQVSTSGLSEGSYIMTIVSNGMNYFQKVMVAR